MRLTPSPLDCGNWWSSSPAAAGRVHDANVVATALAHGVERILTANTDDFMRFSDFVEIVPLRAAGPIEP
jgi:hypothetical protein